MTWERQEKILWLFVVVSRDCGQNCFAKFFPAGANIRRNCRCFFLSFLFQKIMKEEDAKKTGLCFAGFAFVVLVVISFFQDFQSCL